MANLDYRADIDGLRALAVSVVVLFHIGSPAFQGGYVGVDVFFVISGYLITKIIADEMATGRYSILNFYERRLRRLMPSLFVVAAMTLLVAVFLLAPQELVGLAKSSIATMLFAANIFFFRQEGYFDGAAELKPNLHMWSLAVEEQFYLVFPVVLLFLYRFFRPHVRAFIGLAVILSLLASAWATYAAPTFNFYLPITRAWELLVGSLLALGAFPEVRSRSVRGGLAFLGLGLIVVAVLGFSAATPFPGPFALLPILGSALLLWTAEGTLIGRALSLRSVVYVGLISYPLYLVHWPAIVLFKFAYIGADLGDLTIGQSILIVMVSIGCASLLYHFVERPFRDRNRVSSKTVFGVSAGVAFSIVAISGAIIAQNGFPSRGSTKSETTQSLEKEIVAFQANDCLRRGSTPAPHGQCKLGNMESERHPIALLWGDSQAAHLAPAMESAGAETGVAIQQHTKAGCPPILADGFFPENRMTSGCPAFNQAVLARIEGDQRIKVLFVAAQWETYLEGRVLATSGTWRVGTRDSYATISATLHKLAGLMQARGGKLVVVGPAPTPVVDLLTCIRTSEFQGRGQLPCQSFAAAASLKNAADFRQSIIAPALSSGGTLVVIDPVSLFCDNERCEATSSGRPLFLDQVHFSETGSIRLQEAITNALEQAR
ncbi:acyltransferase family protein [Parerythrobacter jejuensis]|uniref:Acyltransferase family protein n=1 Tax=Parerythrobacter jejuensis TaxID=795812 RepID=A0A845AUR2_9SPHN|nr:acyltransferase family protein [Parerythrobacter jejuensis]MXP32923.1 acyltransferase family protein [Parerythrobacter jejuensis]